MTNEGVAVLSVIKWVIAVLMAGFIGHFGKAMAKGVMEWMRRWRDKRGVNPILGDGNPKDQFPRETGDTLNRGTGGSGTDAQRLDMVPAQSYGKTLFKLEKKQTKKKAKLEKKLSKGRS
ncbi:MAG: hypothetical protein N2317_08250 [Syntrophales bacterium]|nr:hypothetical protein [Syntrophales bacterium]